MQKKHGKTAFEKWLPFLLILSYAFASFYSVVQDVSADVFVINEFSMYFVAFEIIFLAIVCYCLLLLILWLYRKILSVRPYFFIISVQKFDTHIKFWCMMRNILMGLFGCVLFTHPYLAAFESIIGLVLSFLVIVATYFSLQKHIDPMFRHMYFKLLLYPWFVFEALSIILLLLMGGV